eukprot:118152-Hanusia_phi.AAC.1
MIARGGAPGPGGRLATVPPQYGTPCPSGRWPRVGRPKSDREAVSRLQKKPGLVTSLLSLLRQFESFRRLSYQCPRTPDWQ